MTGGEEIDNHFVFLPISMWLSILPTHCGSWFSCHSQCKVDGQHFILPRHPNHSWTIQTWRVHAAPLLLLRSPRDWLFIFRKSCSLSWASLWTCICWDHFWPNLDLPDTSIFYFIFSHPVYQIAGLSCNFFFFFLLSCFFFSVPAPLVLSFLLIW